MSYVLLTIRVALRNSEPDSTLDSATSQNCEQSEPDNRRPDEVKCCTGACFFWTGGAEFSCTNSHPCYHCK